MAWNSPSSVLQSTSCVRGCSRMLAAPVCLYRSVCLHKPHAESDQQGCAQA